MSQKTFHTPEFIQKKRKKLRKRMIIVSSSIVFLVAGFVGITHIRKILIDTVQVEGTSIIAPADVQKDTLAFISGNYLWIFGKNNALLYPRQALSAYLLKQFPRMRHITVGLVNYHTIDVQLSEREPFALWCDESPEDIASSSDPTIASNCYFLDQTGFVFSHAPDFSGDAYFKYYGLLPFNSPIGSSYLSSPGTFAELSSFVNSVKALKITPLYIVATDEHDFEMHLYGGGIIMFDDSASLADTASNLKRLLQTANLVPQQNGELLVNYIDLRYGDKVYYKVKGE